MVETRIVNFEKISNIALMFSSLNLSKWMPELASFLYYIESIFNAVLESKQTIN